MVLIGWARLSVRGRQDITYVKEPSHKLYTCSKPLDCRFSKPKMSRMPMLSFSPGLSAHKAHFELVNTNLAISGPIKNWEEGDRERETDTETETDEQIHRKKQTDGQRHRERDRDRRTETQRETYRQRQRERWRHNRNRDRRAEIRRETATNTNVACMRSQTLNLHTEGTS